MNPVGARLVGGGGWVLTIAALLGRGADIDRFAIAFAGVKLEIMHAAPLEPRAANFVVLGEVAHSQTLTTGVSERHPQHLQARHAIVWRAADHIQQLFAEAIAGVGHAPAPIKRKAFER